MAKNWRSNSCLQKPGSSNGKSLAAKYACDGNNLLVDMTSLFANMEKGDVTLQGDPVIFSLNICEGESLSDASYSFTVSRSGKGMKVTTWLKNRKVEGIKTITTPAGKFDCYKITTDTEAETTMEGMNAKMQDAMNAMKGTMPKQKFVMWYAPMVGIIKVDLFSNDKLLSSSEITSIKN